MKWHCTSLGNARGSVETANGSFTVRPGKHHIAVAEDPTNEGNCLLMHSERGKLGDSEDSFLFYCTKINPKTDHFLLSGTFTLREIPENPPGWLAGFGLYAADTIASETHSCRFRNLLSLGRHRSVSIDEYTYGIRIVGGHNDPNAEDPGTGRIVDASRTFSSIQPSALWNIGEFCHMTLKKTDSGFTASISCDNKSAQLSFQGCDFLMHQEPDALYVGFGVAGAFSVEVTDMHFSAFSGKESHTPDHAIRSSVPDYPFSRTLLNDLPPAGFLQSRRHTIYVSPEGSSLNLGTRRFPMNLQRALIAARGRACIVLQDGTYRPDISFIVPERRHSPEETAIVKAEHPGKAVLDGSSLALKTPLMVIKGTDWILQDLIFCHSPSAGLFICGSRNRIENCSAFENKDTGFLLCSYPGSSDELRPEKNTLISCDSYGNCDTAGKNADGFGAKLSVGKENVLIRCIAHHNIDDGFDLYTKRILGPIGSVTLTECIAYENGHTADGRTQPGHGIGFKLGGEGQAVQHIVRDCIAYNNDQAGFSANTNPVSRLTRLISCGNGPDPSACNYHMHPWPGSAGCWETEQLLSDIATDFTPFSCRHMFISDDTSIIPERNADGTIDMHGLFALKKEYADDVQMKKRSISHMPVYMFIVPRTSGGGAEKVITALASRMASDHTVLLVTTVRDDGQPGYPVSSKVHCINIYDWDRRKNTSEALSEPPEEPLKKNSRFCRLRFFFRKKAATTASSVLPDLQRKIVSASGKESKFEFQIRCVHEIKKEFHVDCAVSFLNSANYINTMSCAGERTVISIRSCLNGPFAPVDCRSEDGQLRITKACAAADCIVAVSKETGADLIRRYHAAPERTKTIYNAVHIPEIIRKASDTTLPEDAALMLTLRNAGFVFVSSGRLTEKKGHWHILRAFREVLRHHPDAMLMILGRDGKGTENTRNLLQQIISENHLEEHVFLPGFFSNPYALMNQADAFIMASFNEGFPNALTEAMALHLPVISTDCRSGPREILDPDSDCLVKTSTLYMAPYGILVPECSGHHLVSEPPEPEELILADAMNRLIEDRRLREHYSRKSFIRAMDFRPETVFSQWKAVMNHAKYS